MPREFDVTQPLLTRRVDSGSDAASSTKSNSPLLGTVHPNKPSTGPTSSVLKASMQQYVILMRHGERRDSLPDAPHETDPPLTERGKEEVLHAAQRIKQQIGVSAAKQLMIISSPFVRTMETAAELQRYNIGVDRSATIDNTLCEVFGPLRIKAAAAPNVQQKDAIGDLPRWGESIQDATQRFVHSFLRNANANSTEHVILVSHGDAISAVMTHFYPQRVVYNTDFLSFVVMRRVRGTSDSFSMHGSHGVDWIVEGGGFEDDDAASGNLDHVGLVGYNGRGDTVVDVRGTVEYHDPSVGGAPPSASSRSKDGETDGWGTPRVDRGPPGGIAPHSRTIINILHLCVVLSQVPTLRLWPSIRDAIVYLADVGALEVLSIRFGWRTVVDRLPFSYGSPRRRILYRLARYPLARTLWKCITLLLAYVFTAIPIGWIAGDSATSVMRALGADAWNVLLVTLFVVLDVWRGYLDNDAAEDDPHRESI